MYKMALDTSSVLVYQHNDTNSVLVYQYPSILIQSDSENQSELFAIVTKV